MANEDDVPCCAYCGVCFCVCGSSCVSISIGLFITIIINLIVFVCLTSLLVWMMLRANTVKFQIHDAELTQFDLYLENNNNLHYNLSLKFLIRNSNSYIGIHFDRFEAMVYYSDQRLASVSVPSFYQGHKSTTVLETVFQGQNLVLLGEHGHHKFEDDRKLGVYGIDVKVRIKSRVLFAHLVTWQMNPIIRCHLKIPLGSSYSSGGFDFQPTKCHLHI